MRSLRVVSALALSALAAACDVESGSGTVIDPFILTASAHTKGMRIETDKSEYYAVNLGVALVRAAVP